MGRPRKDTAGMTEKQIQRLGKNRDANALSRQKISQDPEKYKKYKERRNAMKAAYLQKISQDPEKYKKYKEHQNAMKAAYLQKIFQDPEKYKKYKKKRALYDKKPNKRFIRFQENFNRNDDPSFNRNNDPSDNLHLTSQQEINCNSSGQNNSFNNEQTTVNKKSNSSENSQFAIDENGNSCPYKKVNFYNIEEFTQQSQSLNHSPVSNFNLIYYDLNFY